MDIHLVGGAVRDLLLGRPVTDSDYVVMDATPEEFVRRHPAARQVGKSFPVFLLDGCQYAWPRGKTLDDDLTSRDLTINALALGVSPAVAGRLTAHPLALSDLLHRILRPCSGSSLTDDPARVYRAARFAALLPDFVPHPDLLAGMRALAGSGALRDIFPERVGTEIQKALAAPRPGRFLELLDSTRCLDPWFAEIAPASAVPGGPPAHHDTSVLGHTVEVMDRLAGNPLGVWMALCHDLGKTATPKDQWPRHIGHEARGGEMAMAMGNRLRLSQRLVRAGALAAVWHMKAGRYLEMRPGSRVDLLDRLWREGLFEEMFTLAAADHPVPNSDRLAAARRDLAALLNVRLPPSQRDMGAESGRKLRLLRCQALARAARSDSCPPIGPVPA